MTVERRKIRIALLELGTTRIFLARLTRRYSRKPHAAAPPQAWMLCQDEAVLVSPNVLPSANPLIW
jgi:hypothetical protein